MNLRRPWMRWLLAMGLAALLVAPATPVLAANKFSQSPQNPRFTAQFWICVDNPSACSPLFYAWDAYTSINYHWADLYSITIEYEHQSVMMYDAANSPCDIGLGHQTNVFSNGNYYGTIYVANQTWGWHDPADLNFAGNTSPWWTVNGAGFEGVMISSTVECVGYNEDHWGFSVP
jgi:hypothetical protein